MIVGVFQNIVVLLVIVTLLGGIIGYCVATLRAKHLAQHAVKAARLEHQQEKRALASDLQAVRNTVAKRSAAVRQITRADTDILPTLSKRVGGVASSEPRRALKQRPSDDLDIPTLAESELPDSVEELEFDMTGMDEDGALRRG